MSTFSRLLDQRIHNRNLYRKLVREDLHFIATPGRVGYADYSVTQANREGLASETRKLENMLDCSRRFF